MMRSDQVEAVAGCEHLSSFPLLMSANLMLRDQFLTVCVNPALRCIAIDKSERPLSTFVSFSHSNHPTGVAQLQGTQSTMPRREPISRQCPGCDQPFLGARRLIGHCDATGHPLPPGYKRPEWVEQSPPVRNPKSSADKDPKSGENTQPTTGPSAPIGSGSKSTTTQLHNPVHTAQGPETSRRRTGYMPHFVEMLPFLDRDPDLADRDWSHWKPPSGLEQNVSIGKAQKKCKKLFILVSAFTQHLESECCGLTDAKEITERFMHFSGQFPRALTL